MNQDAQRIDTLASPSRDLAASASASPVPASGPVPIADHANLDVDAEQPESTPRVISVSVRQSLGARPRRLRARRVRTEELAIGSLTVNGRHTALGAFEGTVDDLSLTGVGLSLANSADKASLVLHGDRLDRLQITWRDAVLYEGDAHVRRISDRGTDLVLGVEVQASTIDLSEIYRLGQKHSFAERLQVALEPNEDDVSAEFKVWVTNVRMALERIKAFLDAEEHALADLDQFSREEALRTYLEEAAPRLVERFNHASRELSSLVRNLAEDEHPIYRRYFKSQILPLMEHSPILRRAYRKPLGYAGDYEMMNMLYRDHAEGASLFGRVLNLYAAQEPAAAANINRLAYLADKIRAAVEVRGRVRIASIGCGPAREIGALLERHPELGAHMEVALIDQEERVLTYCERTLSPISKRTGLRVQFIRESVRRLLTTQKLREALGERDLIYSAGLFDYLNHRSFGALLSVLYQALAPGGHMLIGNVASHNPSRYFMEYCLDWFLIHRSASELEQFARELTPAPARFEVDAEPMGVNLFLRIWR